MTVSARLRYLRIAPRKVRLVVDLIRGKSAGEAEKILRFTTKKAALPVSKLLKQAIHNAQNNFQLESENLYVSQITVDEGPKQKRWQPRARGQAYEIQKKSSHVTIILDELKKTKKKAGKATDLKKEPVAEATEEKVSKEKIRKSKPEAEIRKPKISQRMKRVFRRKAF